MKKKSLIILILLLIIFSIIIFRHKPYGHSTTYSIKEENLEFKVKETLVKDEGYYLNIKHDDKEYIFHYKDNYDGKKKVLTSIKYYKNGNIECLYPVYIEISSNNILCNKDNKLYSYTSIKEINKNLDIFSDLNLELFKNSNTYKNYNRLNVYQSNIPNNTYLAIWNYKGIDLITKESISSINYLEQDQYDNTHGIMIDNLYITPDYNQKYDFTKFIIIDVKTKKKKEFKLKKEKISYDSYINGIIDNKLYLFDRNNLVEYEFDFKKSKYKVIGNKDLNGKYYDGEWKEINIYDLLNKEIHFSKKNDLKENYQSILESNNSYYLYYNNGEMYQVYKNDLKKKILLFTKKNLKDFKISDDFIFFRDNIDIYMYNSNYGLRKILENSEFNYNSTNIYHVFHEE